MADEILEFEPLFPDDDEDAILARMRDSANEGLDPATDADQWVDTREGSHWFVCVMPPVRELARLYDLAGTEVPATAFPLWAWGSYLDDHAEVQQIERLAATPATGFVRFSGAPATAIPAGATVGVEPVTPDDEVPEYEAMAGGTIPAAAVAPTGLGSNLDAGGTLTDSTVYRYVVTALDGAGETDPSSEVNETASGGSRTVLLDWDDVATATSYRIYRKTGGAGPPWDLLAEVTESEYVDLGGIAPNTAIHPPTVNSTGGAVVLPVQATEEGVAGNVGIGAITVLSTPIPGVSVTNAAPTTGGTEPETDDALRERVLNAFIGQGAGNRQDYERWARAWEGVGRATVIPLWDGPGTVKVIVTTIDGDPVSSETVAGLQADLDAVAGLGEGTAPIGAHVTVTTATARPIEIEATIEFETGYSLDGDASTIALRADVVEALRAYVESVEPGGEVVVSQLVGRVSTISGVHDVSIDLLEGNPPVNIAIDEDPAESPQLGTVTLSEGTL